MKAMATSWSVMVDRTIEEEEDLGVDQSLFRVPHSYTPGKLDDHEFVQSTHQTFPIN